METEIKPEILKKLIDHEEQFKKFGVCKLGLFSSIIAGDLNEDSDLDVFVIFESGRKTFSNCLALMFFLEKLLERRVDLLTPESLSFQFNDQILRQVEYVSFS